MSPRILISRKSTLSPTNAIVACVGRPASLRSNSRARECIGKSYEHTLVDCRRQLIFVKLIVKVLIVHQGKQVTGLDTHPTEENGHFCKQCPVVLRCITVSSGNLADAHPRQDKCSPRRHDLEHAAPKIMPYQRRSHHAEQKLDKPQRHPAKDPSEEVHLVAPLVEFGLPGRRAVDHRPAAPPTRPVVDCVAQFDLATGADRAVLALHHTVDAPRREWVPGVRMDGGRACGVHRTVFQAVSAMLE